MADLTRTIYLEVDNEYVKGAGVVIGAAGSHDDVILEIQFGEMWKNAGAIRFCFIDANGENPTLIDDATLVETNEIGPLYQVSIPSEAKAVPGKATLAIKGAIINNTTDPATEVRSTMTAAAKFIVMESEWDPDAEEAADVTPTQAEQLLALINGKADKTYVDDSVAVKLNISDVLDYLSSESEFPVQSKVIHARIAELLSQIAGKQDTLTFDNTPNSLSSNPVKSSGIYWALTEKQDVLTFDTVPDPESTNPVQSSGIYSAIENAKIAVEADIALKQDILSVAAGNIDDEPEAGSQRPITSGGVNAVKVYLQGEIDTLETNQESLGLTVADGCICLTYSN